MVRSYRLVLNMTEQSGKRPKLHRPGELDLDQQHAVVTDMQGIEIPIIPQVNECILSKLDCLVDMYICISKNQIVLNFMDIPLSY